MAPYDTSIHWAVPGMPAACFGWFILVCGIGLGTGDTSLALATVTVPVTLRRR